MQGRATLKLLMEDEMEMETEMARARRKGGGETTEAERESQARTTLHSVKTELLLEYNYIKIIYNISRGVCFVAPHDLF